MIESHCLRIYKLKESLICSYTYEIAAKRKPIRTNENIASFFSIEIIFFTYMALELAKEKVLDTK